jgi:hypothetical protein
MHWYVILEKAFLSSQRFQLLPLDHCIQQGLDLHSYIFHSRSAGWLIAHAEGCELCIWLGAQLGEARKYLPGFECLLWRHSIAHHRVELQHNGSSKRQPAIHKMNGKIGTGLTHPAQYTHHLPHYDSEGVGVCKDARHCRTD